LLLPKYDWHDDKNHLAVCEADGEDDMLWPLGPHAPWRWNPVEEVDVSAQRVFGVKYQCKCKQMLKNL